MNKIKINKEYRNQLWSGIEWFFLNHPNEYLKEMFINNRHKTEHQNKLIAAAVDVIFLAKVAVFSLNHVFEYRSILRDSVNRGRTDDALEAELKIYMVNNFIDENLNQEQLDIILSTNIKNSDYNQVKTLKKSYSEKELRTFRNIMGQYKRDYISIFEQHEYMNGDNA